MHDCGYLYFLLPVISDLERDLLTGQRTEIVIVVEQEFWISLVVFIVILRQMVILWNMQRKQMSFTCCRAAEEGNVGLSLFFIRCSVPKLSGSWTYPCSSVSSVCRLKNFFRSQNLEKEKKTQKHRKESHQCFSLLPLVVLRSSVPTGPASG